jgi:hypothetical protein
MLSLNLPRIYLDAHLTPFAAGGGGRIKRKACPAQQGGLKSGRTMPKSYPRRNVMQR